MKLLQSGISLLLVIGGYNSSNTNHLAEIADQKVPTYHIEDAGCLLDTSSIRYKPAGGKETRLGWHWLPEGPTVIGITAGASTPNNRIGEVIERILEFRGQDIRHVPPE